MIFCFKQKLKSKNAHYTHSITRMPVTSGGIHLRGLVPEPHSSEETLQQWHACV